MGLSPLPPLLKTSSRAPCALLVAPPPAAPTTPKGPASDSSPGRVFAHHRLLNWRVSGVGEAPTSLWGLRGRVSPSPALGSAPRASPCAAYLSTWLEAFCTKHSRAEECLSENHLQQNSCVHLGDSGCLPPAPAPAPRVSGGLLLLQLQGEEPGQRALLKCRPLP